MYRLRKGNLIRGKLKFYGSMHNRLIRVKEANDENGIAEVERQMEEKKREHHKYLEELPRSFTKSYGERDYRQDINNVVSFYTKWTREDIYETKASLSRVRKYEKLHSLRPFDEVMLEDKRAKELERLSQQG